MATALTSKLPGKPILIRIHADWCPTCQALAATISSLEQDYCGKVNSIVRLGSAFLILSGGYYLYQILLNPRRILTLQSLLDKRSVRYAFI